MSCLCGHLAVVAAPPGWRWDRRNLFDIGGTRLSLTRSQGARWRQARRRGLGTGIGAGVPNGIRIRVPAAFQQEGSQKSDSFPETARFYPEEPSERKSLEDGTLEIVPEWRAATQAREQQESIFPRIVRFHSDDPIEPKTARDEPASEIVPEWRAPQEEKEQLGQEKSISFPPIVRFYPDDPSESNGVENGSSEVVPRWKIAQAEREQQEREKRARELARRRVERRQRELAQRQKQYAEMRERELAESSGETTEEPLIGSFPATSPLQQSLNSDISPPILAPVGSGYSQRQDVEEVGQNSAPVPVTYPGSSYPSTASLFPGQASAGKLPAQDRKQGIEEKQTDGSDSFSQYTPYTNQSHSKSTVLPSAGVVPVQQEANNSSKGYSDDPSAANMNGDGFTDRVFSRRSTMAVREQQEREKRARELGGKKVEGNAAAVALPSPSYRSAASFPSNRASPPRQDEKENSKEGRQTGGIDSMTQGRIEFDWSPPQRSTEVQREKQEREKGARETVRRKIDGNAAATFALPFSSYPETASSPNQHEREDTREGRQTGGIGSMSQGTNQFDSNRSRLPGVEVLPVQQQADTKPLDSWRIPLPPLDTSGSSNDSWRTPLRPADPSGSLDDSWRKPLLPGDPSDSKFNLDLESIPFRRLTQEEREQQEREKRAKELSRRRLERKKRELAEKQRQIALMREKELAEGTAWDFGASLAPVRPISPSETLLDPPTAAYSSSAGYPTVPGSPTESLLDEEEFFEHVLLQRKQTEAEGSGAEMMGRDSVDTYGEPGPSFPSVGSPSVERPSGNALTPLALPPLSSSAPAYERQTGFQEERESRVEENVTSPRAVYPPPASYSALSSSPTEALLNDEEFFEHVLLERKQSEARVTGFSGEMQYRDSQDVSGQPQLALPSVEYPTSAGNALAPLTLPPPIFSSGLPLDDSNKLQTMGDGFPEVVPRRRLTQAEREQQEREKRAKELARRKIERKQRELAQKQKQWAEERERELLENPGGASYSGGFVATTFPPPPSSYPAPLGSPFDGISGAQNAAVDGGYHDSRNTYGQPGYAPVENRGDDLVSRSVAYLQKQSAQNVLNAQNVQNLQNGRFQPLTELKSEINQPEIVEEKMRIWDDMDMLLKVLPGDLREKLLSHPRQAELLEVVLDLGRRPEARFLGGEGEYWREEKITREDLEIAMSAVGDFGGDNRAGIEGTLHRISAIRSRKNQIVGLTCRVGRAVTGQVNMVQDILHSGQSILFLGRPGVGKTTVIREMARVLSDKLHKRVVIVDTSNEIGGDGDVPHPAIGSARRMQVPDPSMQHKVMVEAVENHMPEVVIVDEVGTEADAMACRTIAERGVMLVATAHGLKLENIIKNPTLCDLVGGVQTVILGDEQARSRGSQKSVLERKAPPTFPLLIEMRERNHWVIHQTDRSVDCLLHGAKAIVEVRTRDENFKVVVSRKYYDSNSNGSRMDVLLGS